jgi:nucleotide sugar dehydrogenase
MNVVVIGAGKMGLPLACQIASRGASVVAADKNPHIVESINRGVVPFDEPGVDELLAQVVGEGRLRATTDTTEAVKTADVTIVIVPVLLTPENKADLGIILSVTDDIAAGLKKGAMVVYETTLPVGTTRGFAPLLEKSGLKCGVDFDLAFSPERVKSKLVLRNLTVNPKVVGGYDEKSAARAEKFYADFVGAPVINVKTLEASEFVKLAGMVYRDVNIAIANELARFAELKGIDVKETFPAANTDGEAYLLFPGIGVGGHCTPVYPYFLIHGAREVGMEANLPILARQINDGQAAHCLDRLEAVIGDLKGQRVTIMGLGFRPGVKEHTCSPAFLIGEELARRGADATLNDPLYSDDEIRRHGFAPSAIEGAALVLNTNHLEYADLDWAALAASGVKAVVDGRNFWDRAAIEAAGIRYIGVGR